MRFVMLVKIDRKDAATVADALIGNVDQTRIPPSYYAGYRIGDLKE